MQLISLKFYWVGRVQENWSLSRSNARSGSRSDIWSIRRIKNTNSKGKTLTWSPAQNLSANSLKTTPRWFHAKADKYWCIYLEGRVLESSINRDLRRVYKNLGSTRKNHGDTTKAPGLNWRQPRNHLPRWRSFIEKLWGLLNWALNDSLRGRKTMQGKHWGRLRTDW